MTTVLLNIAAALVALVFILGVWGAVHLLANRRFGERKLGCRGPVRDGQGREFCCKGDGSLCDSGGGDRRAPEG